MIHLAAASLLVQLPLPLSRAILRRAVFTLKKNEDAPKQLLIDISEFIRHDAGTGIQRVVRGIAPYLMETPPAGYVVRPVFAEKNRGYHYAPVTADALQADDRKRRDARPVVVSPGDVFLGLDLVPHLLPRHRGQLLRWKRCGAKLCFLVYDLLPLLHPHWFNPKRHATFKRWLRTVALFGDDLICISGAVKADLSVWLTTQYGLEQPPPHLHSIPLGADLASTMPSTGCADEELEIMERLYRKPFILMVGTLEPRKGYAQTLDAFECYWAKGGVAALVVVGKPGWKTNVLQARLRTHPELNNKLFWFHNASDELLQLLYQAARGVLLASEAEGYGLPLIEAAQYGKPVLARNIPVFREIAGPNASFFDTDSFAEHLESWIQQIQGAKTCPGLTAQTPWSDCAVRLAEIVTTA